MKQTVFLHSIVIWGAQIHGRWALHASLVFAQKGGVLDSAARDIVLDHTTAANRGEWCGKDLCDEGDEKKRIRIGVVINAAADLFRFL